MVCAARNVFLFFCMVALASACSETKEKAERGKSGGAATGGAGGSGTGSTAKGFGGLASKPFEFGPYLPPGAAAGAGVEALAEFGVINMRKWVNEPDKRLSDDYKWRQISATTGSGLLAKAQPAGCADASAFAGGGADGATASGAWSEELPAEDGIARGEERGQQSQRGINAEGVATVAVKKGGATVATIATPIVPTASALKLSGAYDFSLTTSLDTADLNNNLAASKVDLKIQDLKRAQNYNVIVVSFFGGKAAGMKVLRCVLMPGDKVTIPSSTYQQLLPIKAVLGIFANVEVKTAGAVTTWGAAIAGSGVEDDGVP